MNFFAKIAVFILLIGIGFSGGGASQHPSLILTAEGVAEIRANYKNVDSFSRNVARVKRRVEAEMAAPIDVPLPADAGGGYTHEQHKRNYKSIRDAGTLFQITGEQKYADHAKALFLAYADLYPTLGEHPKKKEQAPGRLFWQSLNETVWLVVSIQGYDAIIDTLTPAERAKIESDLLRPMAEFLSKGSAATFDKIHNHGTWATAAVGMTGYVLGNMDLVEKALYGLDKSGEGGFIRQLDELFSPDGYYTEGPYYQRYALMPFVQFAKAIQTNEPERKIFEYRDGILMKAIYSTIQLSYNNLFFPINDALKDKGLDTEELMHGVAVAYGLNGDPALLSVAAAQRAIVLTRDGLALAQGIDAGLARPFPFASRVFTDGAEGDRGALVVMRSGYAAGHQALVLKNTSQGMGHGHFDKLGWQFYDNGREIVSDYGAARFLNVEAKYGGHYLPENRSWAKQTIAHNTVVVDGESHFGGITKVGERHDPVQRFTDISSAVQISSASVEGTYPGVSLTRTMAMINDPELEFPFVVDLFKVSGSKAHQYDLPVHYKGHLIDVNVAFDASTSRLMPLGDKNGYQHLWLKAKSKNEVAGPSSGFSPARITWLNDKRFYTLSTIASSDALLLFAELGANDPNFNLRRENSVIYRIPQAEDATFLSVLEPHGEYNPALEYTQGAHSQITDIRRVDGSGLDYVEITTVHGKKWAIALANVGHRQSQHSLMVDGREVGWTGFFRVIEN